MKKLIPVLICLLFACSRNDHSRNYRRYFFISYRTQVIDSSETYGDQWFYYQGMPSKNAIDSIIADGLERKRECYKAFVLTQFTEFYNKEDFDSFNKNFTGNLDTAKVKKGCCCAPLDWGIQLGGLLRQSTKIFHIDTVGTLIQH